ncbi:MAG: DUF2784 domain-containing protein [Deltaproteobacteria bacterium]|nr:DUF2784 domain-containing protein [Deltaproteobacteria bacterium]MBW1960789.1 DUF2784 domain-containing protein [Deltaproteobacteria bacterium]MBW1995011.1 DUF2784 domain-containing protein [Deltaproteobacteria bacterium]MBW2153504.1 DUF2784 domain-containing protein [Deltaproteobacteria bacterium]
MLFQILLDGLALIHFAFALFAAIGGLFALRWPKTAWFHLPAVLWVGFIEFSGWPCPLTYLEKWLQINGATQGYMAQFILPILYPANLTRGIQILLGTLVIVTNAFIYWVIVRKAYRSFKKNYSR